MTSIRVFLLLFPVMTMAMAAPAAAASSDDGGLAARAAQFCNGTYALCIKAPCTPIASRGKDGASIDSALCSCDVVDGWSMGPASCSARMQHQSGSFTTLMSTYSNLFNATNKTLSCTSTETLWAMCYGAPCVVDAKDPKKANCTCPVKQGAANTLGGDCQQSACGSIWSAATPKADAGANSAFAAYMAKNNPTVPSLPPAQACPATTAPTTR